MWGEFRPPSPASSVRIFSNRHRHSANEVTGSPVRGSQAAAGRNFNALEIKCPSHSENCERIRGAAAGVGEVKP